MKTADPELMRAINRFHVIDAIRRHGPISRTEIADRIELSRATVSAITGALIESGVVHVRHVEPADAATRGRPRVMLALNAAAYHVVGVKLSAHRISISVTDFRADVVRSLVLPVRTSRQPPEVIADLVEDGIRQCVADAGLRPTDISGIGIGLPGFVDGVAGICHWSPIFGAGPVPFAQLMQQRLGMPTQVENDANLVTLAEHWFGKAQGLDSFVVVTIEHSVGMGLFANGQLHRGAHGIGAEFGHVKIDPDGPLCRCGQRGCLDAYASDSALIREARRVTALPEAGDDLAANQVIAEITRRALAGEPDLVRLFERTGHVLGLAIANVVTMLNPPRVIISGEGLRAGVLLQAPLLQAIDRHVLPTLREATEVMFHPWGDEVWARGAATLVLRRIYEAPWL